jgi:prevent-host-death family protein
MQTVGSYEVKTHFRALLDRVAEGEQITITRRGVPVAMLVPSPDVQKANVRDTIHTMLDFRKGWKLEDLSICDLIDEGRR